MWGTHKVGESEKQNYTKRFSSTHAGSWGYNRKRFDKPDRAGYKNCNRLRIENIF